MNGVKRMTVGNNVCINKWGLTDGVFGPPPESFTL